MRLRGHRDRAVPSWKKLYEKWERRWWRFLRKPKNWPAIMPPPESYQHDFRTMALHVAMAVCHRADMIVSWNMKHLANPNKVALINVVNRQNGWPLIRIHTPQEVLGL